MSPVFFAFLGAFASLRLGFDFGAIALMCSCRSGKWYAFSCNLAVTLNREFLVAPHHLISIVGPRAAIKGLAQKTTDLDAFLAAGKGAQ